MNVGAGYRELGPDELVERGDEWWDGEVWTPQVAGHFGVLKTSDPAYTFHTFRRVVSEVPPGTVLESGYRLLKRGDVVQLSDEIMRKGKWRPVPPREVGWKIDKVRGVRRRKTPEGHFQDVKTFAKSTPMDAKELERAVESVMSPGTLAQISEAMDAKVMESHLLKPFTPNKYTRYIPTLDGRKVPVDVYCVLAAFPTGSSAVDHAVKKLLAPGARGVKSRLQDLKEARDSMNRAIELEEADAP